MPARLTRIALKVLDGVLPAPKEDPRHATGRRGEEEVYFWLRKRGYTMVARNWRSPRRSGEVDLIGWNDGLLCFIEVKTRTTRDVKPAEAAVDVGKRKELHGMAREYVRRLPEPPQVRFDVVSVYADAEPPEITLFKNAFA